MTRTPNRRTFLRNTSTMTAAALLTGARGVHSQQQTETELVNSRMNAAVIGTGGRGGSHIGAMLNSDRVTLTHLCEVDAAIANSRASQVESKQGSRPQVVSDIRRLLEDNSIDIVTIATPNHWHALGGIWAMQAGKHAYIEKPVCYNVMEGSALVAAARKYNRMCQVGTQCRSSDACINAVKFMADGGIGEVNFARGLCYKRRSSIGAIGDYPLPESVDFELWSGPAELTTPRLTRPKFHYDWHWQRLYGNGDFGNQGPHQTDVARWGLGLDTHPRSIITYGGRLGYQAERNDPEYVDAGDTANTEVAIFDYGSKCIVFETRGLSVDQCADEHLNQLFGSDSGNKVGVVFYGSQGYVVQRSYNHCVAFDKQMNLIGEFHGTGFDMGHFDNFLDACEKLDHRMLTADVREGHLSAGLSHLGNISYYLGENNRVSVAELKSVLAGIACMDDVATTVDRTVAHLEKNGVQLAATPLSVGPVLQFDPDQEVFTNNVNANQWLTRNYREGFVCPKPSQV
ncbi:MAG: Gfo/Idh/MocA family oxidoreductase [Pirellulaceae bacterium]|nr:Gfo/Idh/MocA family oxidoreductase [Pirellulaceae bacterium]